MSSLLLFDYIKHSNYILNLIVKYLPSNLFVMLNLAPQIKYSPTQLILIRNALGNTRPDLSIWEPFRDILSEECLDPFELLDFNNAEVEILRY